MKILVMSDIHGEYYNFGLKYSQDFYNKKIEGLPDADLCIIAGDLTNEGNSIYPRAQREMNECYKWLCELRTKFPVYWIPGNHDRGINEHTFKFPNSDVQGRKVHPVVCIMDKYVRCWDKNLPENKTYGVSLTTAYSAPELAIEWDYMTADHEVEKACFELIPPDTDIIISHGPPYKILDSAGRCYNRETKEWFNLHLGSEYLRKHIEENNPKLVICGHVHESTGDVMHGKTRIINTARKWKLIEI